MTPFSFEWQWNIGYFLFMGFLYLALVTMGGGLIYSLLKTWLDLGDVGKHKIAGDIPHRPKYSKY